MFLNEINFFTALNPTRIRGDVKLKAFGIADIDGSLFSVFASPRAKYTLKPQDAGPALAPFAGQTYDSTTLLAGGTAGVEAPIFGRINLGSGYVRYSYPGTFQFGGSARFAVPGISLDGSLRGGFSKGLFQIDGSIRGCLAGLESPFTCGGLDAYVGSYGIAACVTIGPIIPGAGYRWGAAGPKIWPIDGCAPSEFWVDFNKLSARRAAQGVTFKIARGEAAKNIQVGGRGGPPSVVVRGPGGRSLTVDGQGFKGSGKSMAGIRVPQGANTFIGVKRGRPGTYTVTPLPGSPPISSLAATRPGYDTKFTARVTGRGSRRVLRYDARKRGGQRVTFVEQGRNVHRVIGTRRGGKGRIRFRPAIGPAGRRKIIAIPTLRGQPIPNQTLTSYRAPGVVRTGRPRRVKLRRRGTRLTVRWSRARGAKRYGVLLRLADGTTRTYSLSTRRRSLRIRRVPRTLGGSVSVSAQGVLLDWGRGKSARFRRLSSPFTVLQTDRSNERRTATLKRRAAQRRAAKRRAAARRRR